MHAPIDAVTAKRIDKKFAAKRLEFAVATYVFDVTHKLAESLADNCIIMLCDKALARQIAEWHLFCPYGTLVVRLKAKSKSEFTYKIGSKRYTYDEARMAIAVDALVAAEKYVGK